ncbi:MAG: HAD-IIB family hydrolase [Lachnospiraceae bacterium]|nr:HAD-IIB family hydrolase [Lachnospiraceae bacterium]
MIKLIVTDMDGCLLDSGGNLPSNFREAYDLMTKQNVIFAAASGRSIGGLKRPFGDMAADMAFVSDNGARIFYKGDILSEELLSDDDYVPLIEEMRIHNGLIPIACGRERTWVEDLGVITVEVCKEMQKYYPAWYKCSFEDIPEKIVKFALLYFDDIEKNIYPYFQRYDNERIRIQVTAYVWIDIYPKNVSKGSAVKTLQDRMGISPSETAVFGDYLNDLSMADHADFSYAPANSHAEVKERFTDVIKSNTENGVTDKIIELLCNQM